MATRSRRFGRNLTESKTARITLAATTPVNRRLICSIAACEFDTSTNFDSLQRGQSAQPNPEPVSRTNDPVMIIK